MNVFGKVVDADGTPVEFATVFVSDSKGSPVTPNRNTSTDTKGSYKLEGVKESDFISVRYVGLNPITIAASKVIKVPLLMIGSATSYIPTLNISMKQSDSNTLGTVEVIAKKVEKSNALRNVLIVSGVLLGVALVIYGVKHQSALMAVK